MQSAIFEAVRGVDAVGRCLALATIFFTGALSAGLGLASAVFLMSSLCASLALCASSQFRPAQGIALDNRVAILTPAVGIAALGASGPPKAQVATAFAAIGISAVMSGLTFWQAGRLRLRRLRRLLRMFPYPVAAELLASSGLPLAHSAFVILTGARSHALIGTELAEPTVAWGVVAAAATAVALGLLLHAGADGGLGL